LGKTDPDAGYTLLNEGEGTSPDSSQKRAGKPSAIGKGIGRDTAFFLGYQVVFAGILYLMPESVTNWTG